MEIINIFQGHINNYTYLNIIHEIEGWSSALTLY